MLCKEWNRRSHQERTKLCKELTGNSLIVWKMRKQWYRSRTEQTAPTLHCAYNFSAQEAANKQPSCLWLQHLRYSCSSGSKWFVNRSVFGGSQDVTQSVTGRKHLDNKSTLTVRLVLLTYYCVKMHKHGFCLFNCAPSVMFRKYSSEIC